MWAVPSLDVILSGRQAAKDLARIGGAAFYRGTHAKFFTRLTLDSEWRALEDYLLYVIGPVISTLLSLLTSTSSDSCEKRAESSHC